MKKPCLPSLLAKIEPQRSRRALSFLKESKGEGKRSGLYNPQIPPTCKRSGKCSGKRSGKHIGRKGGRGINNLAQRTSNVRCTSCDACRAMHVVRCTSCDAPACCKSLIRKLIIDESRETTNDMHQPFAGAKQRRVGCTQGLCRLISQSSYV